MNAIDEHLARFEGEQLATLQHLRQTIARLLPGAVECIKYRMPAFTVNGKAVAGFDGFTNHCSYFPHSGSVIAAVGPLPEWCEGAKGTLRFPIGRRLPDDLVRRLIDVRLAEIETAAAQRSRRSMRG